MKTLFSLATLLVCFALSAQEVPVQQSELPAEAKTFLKEHFKSGFRHAIKDVERNNITYEVVLEDATEIEFTEAGRWREVNGKNNPVPTSFIQKPILDYVKQNYSGEAITKIELDNSEYEVELSNGIDLKFDSRGVFRRLD